MPNHHITPLVVIRQQKWLVAGRISPPLLLLTGLRQAGIVHIWMWHRLTEEV